MLDVPSLLAPVTGHDDPCGVPYHESDKFILFEEAIRQETPAKMGAAADKLWKKADWPGAQALAEQMLREQTKDLRLLVPLAQVGLELDGVSGLVDVAQLAHQLIETFGRELHPRSRDDEASRKAWRKQFGNLDHKFEECVREQLRRAAATGRGAVTSAAAAGFQDVLGRLQDVAGARLGLAPSDCGFARTRECLRDHSLQSPEAPVEAEDEIAPGPAPQAPPGQQEGAAVGAGRFALTQVSQRAAALAQLRLVMDFFRRTEPHSPVSLLLDQALRWADMPLEQWLAQVIDEGDALSSVRKRLGITPVESTDGDD